MTTSEPSQISHPNERTDLHSTHAINHARRRVTIYMPHLDRGGAERIMALVAREFVAHGSDVQIVLVQKHGSFLSMLPANIQVFDLQARNAYTSLPGLIRHLRAQKPDILFSTLDLTNLIALIARKLAGSPARTIIQIVNTVSLQQRSPLKKMLEKWLMRTIYPWADAIIVMSHAAREDFSRYTGIRGSHLHTIYSPLISPELFELADQPVDHPWFLVKDQPILLAAGRLHTQKDFPTLISAFNIVRDHRHARLVILGEGEERPRLQALVDELGLTEVVSMPGFVDNPFAYTKNADVFILSSVYEGLPSILVQALACGCPVVSTDCPSGPAEILANGKYGRLVPVKHPQALATAILDTLEHPLEKPPLQWSQQFELSPVVRRYLDVILSL